MVSKIRSRLCYFGGHQVRVCVALVHKINHTALRHYYTSRTLVHENISYYSNNTYSNQEKHIFLSQHRSHEIFLGYTQSNVRLWMKQLSLLSGGEVVELWSLWSGDHTEEWWRGREVVELVVGRTHGGVVARSWSCRACGRAITRRNNISTHSEQAS